MRAPRPPWPLACLVLATAACSPPEPAPEPAAGRDVLRVGVTVPPQAYLVERLGGERVAIEVLMPSGSSEETFSPSPRQMVALTRADLFLVVGHPAFLVERRHVLPALARNPEARVVAMAGGRQDLKRPSSDPGLSERSESNGSAGAGGGHGHGGASGDPHLWTAPRHMREAAAAVAAALEELDPVAAPLYRARLASLLADLDALDAEVRRELSGLDRRRFLVTHPAWGHFAAEYGLEQVAIEDEGKEPGPRRLVALVELARAEGMRAVFSQAGFPDAAARALAAEIGARVVPLDPLARDWLDNTRATARAIAAALGPPAPAPVL
ncbi:MAG TPA: zinc ABC transporter substrate-binding protein [Thermoanaerobaculia bacterium]|nr:zinc ABC transporter substrate-binding protein [Thermoanaerobaculia bacterium]